MSKLQASKTKGENMKNYIIAALCLFAASANIIGVIRMEEKGIKKAVALYIFAALCWIASAFIWLLRAYHGL